jgi:hypothetical protein
MSKNFIVAATLLALCSFSFAGSPNQKNIDAQLEVAPAQPGRDYTYTCSYTFSSGSGNTYLDYCVTVNGNITYVETPAGHVHIFNPGIEFGVGEGYGICNITNGVVEYHDYAGQGDSGNWDPPILVSQTATSVKISRTTNDGTWTLTQTITQGATTPSIKITMALKNNTRFPRVAYLLRFADVDADEQYLNNFDATQNSAAGWNSQGPANSPSYGLQLENVGTPAFGYWSAFAQSTNQGPNACAFALNAPGGAPLVGIDGSVEMVFADTLAGKITKTATVTYRGF